MDFFDIGPMEVLVVLIVALIAFGPGKVVDAGRTMGKAIHSFRKAAFDLTDQISKEVAAEKESSAQPKGKKEDAAAPDGR